MTNEKKIDMLRIMARKGRFSTLKTESTAITVTQIFRMEC